MFIGRSIPPLSLKYNLISSTVLFFQSADAQRETASQTIELIKVFQLVHLVSIIVHVKEFYQWLIFSAVFNGVQQQPW